MKYHELRTEARRLNRDNYLLYKRIKALGLARNVLEEVHQLQAEYDAASKKARALFTAGSRDVYHSGSGRVLMVLPWSELDVTYEQ